MLHDSSAPLAAEPVARPGLPRRLLLLNWRDPWNPRAGGAELVTLRCLERLAQRGWVVEWFSASYPGAASEEVRDGIRYIRAGSQATVHIEAYRRYAKQTSWDIVVDEINTIPFMTPLYFKSPHVVLMYQLAQEVWLYEMGPVIGHIGRAMEPLYLRPYKHSPVISISHSSIESLKQIGLHGKMHLLPLDVDEPADPVLPEKSRRRDVVFLGRVTPSKRVEHSVRAAALMRARGWKGELIVAGGGDERYVETLRTEAARIGAPVQFIGRVSDIRRTEILRSAAALWMTSVREGWGLVVTEAARHGTPSVVYRVPGLVDAVADGQTGYVVDQNPEALAAGTLRLFGGDYVRFCAEAKRRSEELSWDKTADVFEAALLETIAARERAR